MLDGLQCGCMDIAFLKFKILKGIGHVNTKNVTNNLFGNFQLVAVVVVVVVVVRVGRCVVVKNGGGVEVGSCCGRITSMGRAGFGLGTMSTNHTNTQMCLSNGTLFEQC